MIAQGIAPRALRVELSTVIDKLRRRGEDRDANIVEMAQGYIPEEPEASAEPLLHPADAVYGFAAWLTTRDEPVTLGAQHDAAPAAELVKLFLQSQGLDETSQNYPGSLKPYPVEAPTDAVESVEDVAEHVNAITQAIRDDEGYAISWHANIAMAFQDEGGDRDTANRAAARFMQQLFGVDTGPLSALPLPEAEGRS